MTCRNKAWDSHKLICATFKLPKALRGKKKPKINPDDVVIGKIPRLSDRPAIPIPESQRTEVTLKFGRETRIVDLEDYLRWNGNKPVNVNFNAKINIDGRRVALGKDNLFKLEQAFSDKYGSKTDASKGVGAVTCRAADTQKIRVFAKFPQDRSLVPGFDIANFLQIETTIRSTQLVKNQILDVCSVGRVDNHIIGRNFGFSQKGKEKAIRTATERSVFNPRVKQSQINIEEFSSMYISRYIQDATDPVNPVPFGYGVVFSYRIKDRNAKLAPDRFYHIDTIIVPFSVKNQELSNKNYGSRIAVGADEITITEGDQLSFFKAKEVSENVYVVYGFKKDAQTRRNIELRQINVYFHIPQTKSRGKRIGDQFSDDDLTYTDDSSDDDLYFYTGEMPY